MSTVFVSVGQCGNQVGYSYWETVLNWNITEEKRIKKPAKDGFHAPFMKRNGDIPWIMVDSERKVVTGCLSKQIAQLVPAANRLSHRKGYGGNWALGYCEQKKEGSLMEQTLECLRKEAERLDMFSGTVLFHSLAGGTGSGMLSVNHMSVHSVHASNCTVDTHVSSFLLVAILILVLSITTLACVILECFDAIV